MERVGMLTGNTDQELPQTLLTNTLNELVNSEMYTNKREDYAKVDSCS